MKVSDILRVKGNTLYTVHGDQPLMDAITTMSEKDIGSLVVVEQGEVAGVLTFREVIQAVVQSRGQLEKVQTVRSIMDATPLICTPDTSLDEVRRMMLGRHARYLPVLDGKVLMGVISFYDVAKTVVDSQNLENKLLKAYIRDWPQDDEPEEPQEPKQGG